MWTLLTDTSWFRYVLPMLLALSFVSGRTFGRVGTLRRVRHGARMDRNPAMAEWVVDTAIREGGADRRRPSALLRDSPAFSPVTPIDRDRDGFWRQTRVACLRTSPAFAGPLVSTRDDAMNVPAPRPVDPSSREPRARAERGDGRNAD